MSTRAKAKPLLETLGMVTVKTSTLIAKEKFVFNVKNNDLVKILYIGENFKKWFLKGWGKIEYPTSHQTVHYHELKRSASDNLIIAKLGGKAKVKTTLSEMFYLMENQGHGEYVVLLKNRRANIFYINDQNGVLRVVLLSLGSNDCWQIEAYPIQRSVEWNSGARIFSRSTGMSDLEDSAFAA